MTLSSGTWRKCTSCSRVQSTAEFDGEERSCRSCTVGSPAPRRSSSSGAAAVAAYRQRTGGAYDKAYRTARDQATKALIAAHPEEFAALLDEARRTVGLGPTRR